MERGPLGERAIHSPPLHFVAWIQPSAALQEFKDFGELPDRHLVDQGHAVSEIV